MGPDEDFPPARPGATPASRHARSGSLHHLCLRGRLHHLSLPYLLQCLCRRLVDESIFDQSAVDSLDTSAFEDVSDDVAPMEPATRPGISDHLRSRAAARGRAAQAED